MSKKKIIVGIVIITALVIGGYYYFQNWQDKMKESLFGSVSTTFEPSATERGIDASGEKNKPTEPGQTKEPEQSVPTPPKIITFENPVETISQPELPAELKIQEQILKPEIPSQISEKKFSPVAPPQSIPEPPIILAASKNIENEEEPEESVSTSTPAILPQVSIYLSGYSITARDFTVIWQSSSTDISTFNVDRKISFGDWENWLASTTATSTIFEVLQDLTTYYFRVRATSNSSTTSDWQEISAPIYFYPIVINEIAWAGTSASTTADEWIELYNKSDQTINLSGWAILEKNATTTILKNSIAPRSYYLIERTDDTTVSDIMADLAKSFGGSGLSNSGENLRLVDQQNQIIDIIDCSGGWLAGSAAPDYKTMERVNPYLAFDVPGNWQSNNGLIRNGLNAFSQSINGTPKAQNSVFNLEFFYLYPAKNTTATSTALEWTPNYINNFNEYKVIRSFDAGFNPASTTIVAATTNTGFFDELLESETTYYYKISACPHTLQGVGAGDLSDYCVPSNIASTTTSAFPFSWSEPQLIYQISTTTPEGDSFDFILDANNQPQIIWSNSSSTSEVGTSTETMVNVLNNKNQPYVFWAENGEIYFKYLKGDDVWTEDKLITNSPGQNLELKVLIEPDNIAHIVWQNDQMEIWYTFGKIE